VRYYSVSVQQASLDTPQLFWCLAELSVLSDFSTIGDIPDEAAAGHA
jgi:hypothetical protein